MSIANPPENGYRSNNHALVRELNLSTVMNSLHAHAPITQAALAQMTGFNKATVANLVEELISYRLIYETGADNTQTGQTTILLALNPLAGCIVSSEIGVDFISVMCTDFTTQLLWQSTEKNHPNQSQEEIINQVLDLIQQAIDYAEHRGYALLGLAVGVPGIVDQGTGTLLYAPNLDWQYVPMKAILTENFNCPIFVDNEANFAALGEQFFGVSKGYGEVLYINTGIGLGGAIVRHGQIFKGIRGFAGELGHITLDPDGDLCKCGNRGCWETQVSQATLFRHIKRAVDSGRTSKLMDLTSGDLNNLTVETVVKAAHAGDPVALEALEKIGHHLGIGIASLVNILNPQLVVFGGILSLAGKFLLPIIEDEIQQRALIWNSGATRVVLAKYSTQAPLRGGIGTVYHAILTHPAKIGRELGMYLRPN